MSDEPITLSQKFVIAPFVIITIILLGLVAWSAAVRISRPYPLTPWESAIVADAWRVTQGIPVYTNPASGHATHMYGPLVTYLNAGIFALTDPNLFTPRLVALFSTIGTCALLASAFTRRQPIWIKLFAFALFAAQFFIARAAYAETRPDAISVFFAVIGLLLIYRAHASRDPYRIWAGTFAIVVATFFKQTALLAVAVPAFSGSFAQTRERRLFNWDLQAILAMLLIVAFAATLTFIYTPWIWHYMVRVPAKFPFTVSKLPRAAARLIVHDLFPITIIVMTWRQRRAFVDLTSRYLVGAAWISVWLCMFAFIKSGGGENSFLPALLALNALALMRLPFVLRRSRSPRKLALFLSAIVILQTILPPRVFVWSSSHARHGDKTYTSVIERARELPGRVVCFDDPTIPLFADRNPGRSLDCELDAVGQKELPAYFLDDVRSADWILRVHATWDAHVKGTELQSWGFTRVDDPKITSTTYSLWKRVPMPPHP